MAAYGKLHAAQTVICARAEKGLTRKTTGKLDRVCLPHDRSEEFTSRSISKFISYLTEKTDNDCPQLGPTRQYCPRK